MSQKHCFLGLDTSNYTTSAALYFPEEEKVRSVKKLLPVKEGAAGLRQSDAVFSHIRQLPEVMKELFCGEDLPVAAVCASEYPRSVEGSYMPAFLVGAGASQQLASAMNIPYLSCSHQEGHIVAALHSAAAMELLSDEFYAFHVSGGTTECLLVRPAERLFTVELVAKTLDLNAGQLIDRVGLLLGLRFPCGAELDALSRKWGESFRETPAFRGMDCCLSGGENRAAAMLRKGMPPEAVARFAIDYVRMAVCNMTEKVMSAHGKKPLLYAGGVMSNSLIREECEARYGGRFAAPEFSSDNAAGVAVIAGLLTDAALSPERILTV